MNELRRWADNAQRDIENIKAYIQKCTDQAQKVAMMDVRHLVRIYREKNSWENKVWYYITLLDVIYYEGQEQARIFTMEHRKIPGKDRIQAFQYAQELSKKYNCPVILEGHWPESIRPKFAKVEEAS
jgi:plasmid stabilization system protein ParE